MKKLLLSAALTAMLASPAFAQSYNAGYGTGNVINQPALEHGGSTASAARPLLLRRRASAPVTRAIRVPSRPYRRTIPTPSMTSSGDYAGRDPDPNIRFELHRDNARDE